MRRVKASISISIGFGIGGLICIMIVVALIYEFPRSKTETVVAGFVDYCVLFLTAVEMEVKLMTPKKISS